MVPPAASELMTSRFERLSQRHPRPVFIIDTSLLVAVTERWMQRSTLQ